MTYREWTPDDLAWFKLNYSSKRDHYLAVSMGRTAEDVERMAIKLALRKSKVAFPGAARMPRWKLEEVQTLMTLYPGSANHEIALQLGRSTRSVISKAHALGLKKSRERLTEMGKVNVTIRRDRRAAERASEPERSSPPLGDQQTKPPEAAS